MGPQLHSVSLNALALELVLIHAIMATVHRVQGVASMHMLNSPGSPTAMTGHVIPGMLVYSCTSQVAPKRNSVVSARAASRDHSPAYSEQRPDAVDGEKSRGARRRHASFSHRSDRLDGVPPCQRGVEVARVPSAEQIGPLGSSGRTPPERWHR